MAFWDMFVDSINRVDDYRTMDFSRITSPIVELKAEDVLDAAPEVKRHDRRIERVNPYELENIFVNDEVAFNGVVMTGAVFRSGEYPVTASNNKQIKETEEFLEEVINIKALSHQLAMDACVHGGAYAEILRAKDDVDDIRGVAIIDPKVMDIRRDGEGKPLYDKFNRPLEYVQYVYPDDITDLTETERTKIVEQLDPFGNASQCRIIKRENIIYVPLYRIGTQFRGIGLLEPMYNTTQAKQTIRNAITQSVQRVGLPTISVAVGDETHHPTPKLIKKVNEKIKNINERTAFAHAFWIKPNILESKRAIDVHKHLERYEASQVTALGIPKPIALWSGEDTNRSTLERQSFFFELRVSSIAANLLDELNSRLLVPFARFKKWAKAPKIRWQPTSVESVVGRTDRLAKLVAAGLLRPDAKLRAHIRELENLPPEQPDAIDNSTSAQQQNQSQQPQQGAPPQGQNVQQQPSGGEGGGATNSP